MENFIKKRKTTITPVLKKAVWDLYIGPGITYAKCPLCGVTELSRNTNSGFEAAHIVADKFMIDTNLNSLYLFPSCKQCNNDCMDYCILDYLWCRERYDVLRDMMWAIFSHYIRERPVERDSQAWKVLDHLYGVQRFPSGGGLVNQSQIYGLCTTVQVEKILHECTQLSQELQRRNETLKNLMTATYPNQSARFM